jgi:hypothetical protein
LNQCRGHGKYKTEWKILTAIMPRKRRCAA